MINIVGSSSPLSRSNTGTDPLTYSQLFDLKVAKLQSEYLKNRGNAAHYRNWLSLLAAAHRWEMLVEAVLAYRHDAPEFDAINAFYLSKRDVELNDDPKSSYDILMFYYYQYPEDIECVFLLSLSGEGNPILNENLVLMASRFAFHGDTERLSKNYSQEVARYPWLKELALFRNPKHVPSHMERVPVYVFLSILSQIHQRGSYVPIPAIEEEIQLQVKENPFDVRLLSLVLNYYCELNDHHNADRFFKLLSQLVISPCHIALYSLSHYEKLKGRQQKALELASNDRANSFACCIQRLGLLSALKRTDEWISVFEKNETKFVNQKGFEHYRIWYLGKKLDHHFKEKNYELAEEYANKILKTNAQSKTAYHALVVIYLSRGNFKKAWSYYDTKLNVAPGELDVFLGVLAAGHSYERLKEMEQCLRANFAFHPGDMKYIESLVNLLIYQSKYDEALEIIKSCPNLDEILTIKREKILYRLKLPSDYQGQLKKCVLLDYHLAELSVDAGDYNKALDLFKGITPTEDVDTLKAYLRCLMALGLIQEAKNFLNRLDGNRKLRLRELRTQIEEAKIEVKREVPVPKPVALPQPPQFVEKPKVLIGLTPNAISLLKGEFSRKPCCGNEGVDPLLYSGATRQYAELMMSNQTLATSNFIYYPESYSNRLKEALRLIEKLKEVNSKSYSRAHAYLIIYYLVSIIDQLSPLNPSPESKTGMSLFSARVLPIETLNAIRSNLINIPALTTEITIYKFAKEFIDSGIEFSISMSFSDPEPLKKEFSLNKLENGERWESYKDHIQAILHLDVIRNELAFMMDKSHVYLEVGDEDAYLKPFLVSAERIRASIAFIQAFDSERGEKLKKILPEVVGESEAVFDFSLSKLNRLLPLAKLKSEQLEKI